jgi:hypothetical protein
MRPMHPHNYSSLAVKLENVVESFAKTAWRHARFNDMHKIAERSPSARAAFVAGHSSIRFPRGQSLGGGQGAIVSRPS